LLDRFNPKVYAIEELNDLKTLSIDQLIGTLTAYEMRISKDKSITREASFKEDKNIDFELDDIEEKICEKVKERIKKISRQVTLQIFNCGKIGHFESKCPHKKKDQNSDDENKYKFKKYSKKKRLCANNYDSSEDIDSDSSTKIK
jgi:hypothetical protein